MGQYIYLITDPNHSDISQNIEDDIFINKVFKSKDFETTEDILIQICKECPTEYFYIISLDREVEFLNYKFSYKPEEWDKEYVHIWNNDFGIKLFNKKIVSENPSGFTTQAIKSGLVKIKNIPEILFQNCKYDIVFLSYDEKYADENYHILLKRFPYAKRVHGIKGIYEAHKAASNLSDTRMFYVIDADAEVLSDFNFDYSPGICDRYSIHVWHSKNPVNNLEYGYGGIKLFPTNVFQNNKTSIDITTGISNSLKVMPFVSNITNFNIDEFSSWRSGFRECAKLASKIIPNQLNSETDFRLNEWCNVGSDKKFGNYVIDGAKKGREFGLNNSDISLINDYEWLNKIFQDSVRLVH